ncbi:MAG: glutamate-5-semialdehyde dehydrogenase [Oscillospiraceae bacterium]|jgi:glutamate-5-semialdehyde dehydrogenase|nr:glutamate-5-semialdehyde dehydrogenase [Oscillospiraceae bacterium]
MTDEMLHLGENAREAARGLGQSSGAARNAALAAMAEALQQGETEILRANEADLAAAAEDGMSLSLQDRLRLTPARILGMIQGIRDIRSEADPLGLVLGGGVRPNGLRVERVSTPLGVVAVIYEARPNVTADAAALCVKSGNAVILRGGKEAIRSNTAIAGALRNAVVSAGLPADCIQLVADTSRESARALMGMHGYIDVLIPRGGAGLIRAVVEQSTVPVIETGAGNCHVYMDAAADVAMACDIIENAKTSRPSVCNAIETVLIHQAVAREALPRIADRLEAYPVELRCDPAALAILAGRSYAVPAAEEDWGTEYGELILAVRIVRDMNEALEHIRRWSTGHSECIVTGDYAAAQRFLREVDAAAVYVNASTRFTDGGEFGYGAEIGISTQKLHARGPLGLRHLTSEKYLVTGEGQVRT